MKNISKSYFVAVWSVVAVVDPVCAVWASVSSGGVGTLHPVVRTAGSTVGVLRVGDAVVVNTSARQQRQMSLLETFIAQIYRATFIE